MPETTIMIVEDHPLFSRGLSSLISTQGGYSIIGEAKNSAEALELVRSKKPHLAIVDLNLGDEDGLDVIKEMKALDPDIIVLVLSMHDERYYAERVLGAGGRGYIMKAEAGDKVIEAIKTVMSGKVYVSDAERERLFEYITSVDGRDEKGRLASINKLSDRQLQIFTFMGKGLGAIEIAAKLGISTKTVDTHKEHIKQRLHCNTTQELRQLAIEWTGSRKF
jgi:DNA-binding NarL/FixJ family response regulator